MRVALILIGALPLACNPPKPQAPPTPPIYSIVVLADATGTTQADDPTKVAKELKRAEREIKKLQVELDKLKAEARQQVSQAKAARDAADEKLEQLRGAVPATSQSSATQAGAASTQPEIPAFEKLNSQIARLEKTQKDLERMQVAAKKRLQEVQEAIGELEKADKPAETQPSTKH